MMRHALLVAAVFLSLAMPARAGQAGGAESAIRLTSVRTQDGVTTVWEIPPARARGWLPWNPEAVAAPLSVADAVKAARTWLVRRNPGVRRFDLQNVSLSHVRRGDDGDFWYYQIDFFAYGAASPPGGGPLYKAVILLDGSVVEPTQSGGEPAPPGAHQPGAGITMPHLLRDVKPNYTAEALQRKISGSVSVQGVVGLDGALHNLRVVRSLDAIYGLDEEALKAAAQWQFVPGTRDGQPVPVVVTVELTFTAKK